MTTQRNSIPIGFRQKKELMLVGMSMLDYLNWNDVSRFA